MIIIDYNKKHHKKIIDACILALKQGKVVAYPTDTSYGLAVDVSNTKAIKNLYKVKGRDFKKAVSVVVPSVAYAKKIVVWKNIESILAKKFWPLIRPDLHRDYVGQAGTITIVSKLKVQSEKYKVLTANSGFLGLRMPNNNIALDLAKCLKSPITATSANVSGMPDCYSAEEIVEQYKNKKVKPDIIINAGKLPKIKPSTIVKIFNNQIEIIRQGEISTNQILKNLKSKI